MVEEASHQSHFKSEERLVSSNADHVSTLAKGGVLGFAKVLFKDDNRILFVIQAQCWEQEVPYYAFICPAYYDK